ncbi:BTB domain containing protein [Pandoravirus japonicus]|uniref:BTB domain containing protein n=1 Tax=Pandoravirus japonicus TaxID=2823154 RepID=A0A811BQP4_9VIRU|nr:BTB domain containing protein [Pandoravirus japonicus]
MSDDDFADDFYDDGYEATTLGSLRHVHCDCVIELRAGGTGPQSGGAPVRIDAHRAVLATAPYFAALFEHADPDRVEQRGPDGKRILRAVYVVDMPFLADSVDFLVGCLYAPRRFDIVGSRDDPIDIVNASIFLGMPRYCIARLMEASLAGILSAAAKGSVVDQLGAFVRHLLNSDVDSDIKTALIGRTLGMLSGADRNAIGADHAGLMPTAYYRPVAVIGGLSDVDEDGRRWRTLRIAIDNWDKVGASTITWQGLVFGVTLQFTNYEDEPLLTAAVSCGPEGETLGAWSWDQGRPEGVVDVEPRAVRIRADGYHPTRGSTTKTTHGGLKSIYKGAPGQPDHHVALPDGAFLAPFDFASTMHGARGSRSTRTAFLSKYESGTATMRSLVACEVEIQVEEIGC